MADYDSKISLGNNQVVTIVGNGAVLDARKKGPLFWVHSSRATLTLESITLKNGYYQGGSGGVIAVDSGALTIKSGTFLDNSCTFNGGAVNVYGGVTMIYIAGFLQGEHSNEGCWGK
jgi:predicted outer membrane repeat protein